MFVPFGLGKRDLGRDPRDGRLAVARDRGIDDGDRARRDRVVRRGREDDLLRAGDRLDLERAVRRRRGVAPDGLRIGAVGPRGPEVLVRHRVAVDVVPPGVEDQPALRHRGEPLVRVVERERAEVPAVGVHAVQRVDVPARAELRAEAAGVAAAARRAERDAAVGQIGRHEVVVRAAGELAQARAVDVHFVDVVEAFVALVVELEPDRTRCRP